MDTDIHRTKWAQTSLPFQPRYGYKGMNVKQNGSTVRKASYSNLGMLVSLQAEVACTQHLEWRLVVRLVITFLWLRQVCSQGTGTGDHMCMLNSMASPLQLHSCLSHETLNIRLGL